MRTGRSRPSLGERAAQSGVVPPAPPQEPVAEPAPRQRTDADRHCWVLDPPEWPGTWPGLLVEWRQRADGWHGRVAYTVGGPHGPVLVEAWLPADRLQQR
jgi:hypothetical protein